MIRPTQSTRVSSRWSQFAACIVIIVCSGLLYWLSGGFSQEFWRLLEQARSLPMHGWDLAPLLPLAIPLLLVLIILMMWIYLSIVAINVCVQYCQNLYAPQRVLQADRRAEDVAGISINDENGPQRGSWQAQDEALASIQMRRTTRPLGDNESGEPADDELSSATALSPAWSSQDNQLTLALPVTPQWSNSFSTMLSYRSPIDTEQQDIPSPDTGQLADEITQRLKRVTKDGPSTASHADQPECKEPEQGPDSDQADQTSNPPEEEARLLVGVSRDAGIARKDAPNEDALFALQAMRVTENEPTLMGFFAVADGMGGHANGQEASHVAIQALRDTVVPGMMRDVDGDDSFLELLKEGVLQANQVLYQRNSSRERIMGTTLTAALVVGRKAYIVNVGDSRTYIYRKGAELFPVTRDHSLVACMVESGLITRDQLYTHPRRNQIYRCLGDCSKVAVDTFVEELDNGDVLLLCSDGLWEMVRDNEIQEIVASTEHPTRISNTLMQTALSNGGEDNISVIVARMVCAETAR